MGDIRVGTPSWTDKTLVDCQRFYHPRRQAPRETLNNNFADHGVRSALDFGRLLSS